MKKIIWILLALTFTFLSCEDDEEPNFTIPDGLVGTWYLESPDAFFCQSKEYSLLTFTKENSQNGFFEDSYIGDYLTENVFVVLEATKGSFTRKDNKLYPIPSHYGSQIAFDEISTTDTTVWWGPEDTLFDNFEYYQEVCFRLNGSILEISINDNPFEIYTRISE